MKELVEPISQKRVPITPQFRQDAGRLSNGSNTEFPNLSMRYRDWQIGTKVIHGQLWLQWQHPQERFARYAIRVIENRIADTILHAQLLIDLVIHLEQEAVPDSNYPQIFSLDNTDCYGVDSHEPAPINSSTPQLTPVSSSETWKKQDEFSLIENRWG